jgi:1-deoxy-D-xylulose-5-phosphate reductoisomerase
VTDQINGKKGIAILGSTGSIGTQALEVITAHPGEFEVIVLSAENNADLLIKQAKKFKPDSVVISNPDKYQYVSESLYNEDIKVYAGKESLAQIVEHSGVDMVLTALVGSVGLLPTINAIKAKKSIALANKETLVVAGELITKLALEHEVEIIPVDSEHSAIFQCLAGEFHNKIEKIYLTASGGPFRGYKLEMLKNVTAKQALQHPTWNMGAKITIDSASLMNKGLEVIEAKWLFALEPNQIDVVVHPQSIIHSIVQFQDGSMKAQMGLPDMKLPIQYALTFPNRIKSGFPRFNFMNYPNLSFEQVDSKIFRNLAIAFNALESGGNMPCIMNAANEIAVEAFLNDNIGFIEMSDLIEKTISMVNFIEQPDFDGLIQTDAEARMVAKDLIKNKL